MDDLDAWFNQILVNSDIFFVVSGLACVVSLFRFDAFVGSRVDRVGEACPVPFLLEESRLNMSEVIMNNSMIQTQIKS